MLMISTGGTIGALPYDDPRQPPHFSTMPTDGRDIIRDALGEQFSTYDCRYVAQEQRDSKDIDAAYLENLLAVIRQSPERAVLITHGTDRILQTAERLYFLAADLPDLRTKTILLTGAMVPLANGRQSDGYQNLAFSLEFLAQPNAPQGIFIVLSDYADSEAETGLWAPRLYPFEPGAYEKVYMADGRYNRLRRA